MGRNSYFQFKQFRIIQKDSAMKVGTDGILLGAWANVTEAQYILDVGTGTGLIALMLAQRSDSNIVGIDIEKSAVLEAKKNVQESPWQERIQIQNTSFQDFVNIQPEKYGMIISNPPFFENNLKSGDNKRNKARHTDSLPFRDLILGTIKILEDHGRFSVILPTKNGVNFIKEAKQEGLFLSRLTKVKPATDVNANRFLMEFQKNETALQEDCFIIYKNSQREYSDDFKKLTKKFYLNF